MTAGEVVAAARQAGITLSLAGPDAVYARPRASLTPELREAIREHKDRLIAIIKMREIHLAMGLTEEDILFVEEALLSGRIQEIRIAVRAPDGAPA